MLAVHQWPQSRPHGAERSDTQSSARHTPPAAERGRWGVGDAGESARRAGYCVGVTGENGGVLVGV